MEGVPDDLFQSDLQSFPAQDPRITEELRKKHEKALKAQHAAELAEARERKKEAAAAQKAQQIPTAKERQQAKVDASKTTRARELKAHKIRLYFKKFSHKLSIKEPKALPKDDEGLDEILASIECELQSSGGIEQAGIAFINVCSGVEKVTEVWNPLGLMLSGPAASLSQTVAANRAKWDELITELAIAHAEWFMVGPVKRAGILLAQMVMTVDNANRMAVLRAQSAPPSDKMKEEAEDL